MKTLAKFTLTQQIMVGLALGVTCGLFFGDRMAGLAIVGRAYIGLLQMSILPYMVVSLIAGIGSLTPSQAGRLALTGGVVLVASWLLAFGMIFLLPLAFPPVAAGQFYSSNLVQVSQVDFIDLYIPSNPFRSLARTVIPAVAVFSVVVGIALMGLKQKQPLIDLLAIAQQTMTRVAMLVVKLTPIGVFAIAANASGTMTIQELDRLQVYLCLFVAATLVLTFWVLPAAVAAFTPLGFWDVLKSARTAMVTGFVTANLFIVLPVITENAKALFKKAGMDQHESGNFAEVLVPASFNFPNVGKLLTLLFILFAGWYTGSEIPLTQYPGFASMGLLTLFGGVDLALPFLLDRMHIASDMYQLYVMTGVVNGWFATLLAVMNLYAFTLVATCAAMGNLRIRWNAVLRLAVITTLIMGGLIVGARIGMGALMGDAQIARQTLAFMTIDSAVDVVVHKTLPPDLVPADPNRPRLDQILERGTLRIGFNPSNLPFSYLNQDGELVGHDVELMYELARGAELGLEFIPWDYDNAKERMNGGLIDIAIGGLMITPTRLKFLDFSKPYMELTASVLVPDHDRHDYGEWAQIGVGARTRLGVVGRALASWAEQLANVDVVNLDSMSDYVEGNSNGLDGVIVSAEAGSAWTILHPDYAVAIPRPFHRIPVALPVPRSEPSLRTYLDSWIDILEATDRLDELYDKWILGKGDVKKKPRWCIYDDVLGWGDAVDSDPASSR